MIFGPISWEHFYNSIQFGVNLLKKIKKFVKLKLNKFHKKWVFNKNNGYIFIHWENVYNLSCIDPKKFFFNPCGIWFSTPSGNIAAEIKFADAPFVNRLPRPMFEWMPRFTFPPFIFIRSRVHLKIKLLAHSMLWPPAVALVDVCSTQLRLNLWSFNESCGNLWFIKTFVRMKTCASVLSFYEIF